MFYVYVLISEKDGNWYTGYTEDLNRRISDHNQGQVIATKHRAPLKCIYFEVSAHEKDARAREKYLKSGMGKRYLRNRLKYQLSKT